MLDDAADEEQAEFRKISILITRHLGLAVFPDGEVAMHARTIVAHHRLWHEGCRLAVGMGDVVDHVFVNLHVIGSHGEGLILGAEFMLGRSHFMVVLSHQINMIVASVSGLQVLIGPGYKVNNAPIFYYGNVCWGNF